MSFYTLMESPVDTLLITGDGESITSLWMTDQYQHDVTSTMKKSPELFSDAVEQLHAYFAGELTTFDLPLNPKGTPFQKSVWQTLLSIPFGETVSYQTIANKIDNPKAVRAVGAANGKNPIGLVIPCHRVIGHNGKLTGYAGGLHRKQWLLEHEQHVAGQQSLFE